MPEDIEVLTADQARADKDTKELTQLAKTVAKTADAAKLIQNDVQFARAGEILVEIKTVLNKTEKRRKALTAPILKHKADIDAFFAEFTDPLEVKEKVLKQAVGAYTLRREQERIAEQAKLTAATAELQKEIDLEAETAGVESVQLSVPVLVESAPAAKGVSVKMLWTYEIVDPEKVPREYMSIDSAKINAAIKGEGGIHAIPGLRVYQVASTAVRGNS